MSGWPDSRHRNPKVDAWSASPSPSFSAPSYEGTDLDRPHFGVYRLNPDTR